MTSDDPGGRSLAGLSEHGAPAGDDAHHPFATTDDRRYRELRVVGEGGLGTVLLAHDERLAREVALKRIGPNADEQAAAAAFLREARITARLDHPGIVPIHDAGITADGRPYYTMRLIRGRSLAELADAAHDLAARLALVGPLTAACHAVGHAHRQGIVHRDLKPANVMIGELGETQVIDWGLAEELELAAAGVDEGFVGTVAYLSPEAARGDGCTAASDVWSLGVVLHEVVTGARRFSGSRDEVVAALRTQVGDVAWPDDCPAELRAIGTRAMALDPAARYPDAEAMARDLEAYRDGRRVGAYAYSALELLRRFVVAWRWPLAIVAVAVIATIAALALTAHRTEAQRARAVAAEGATRAELARADAALGWALATSAVGALDAGDAAHAEVLAAHALLRGESADARGVIAATRAGARPDEARRVEIPGCTSVVPASHNLALCVEADRVAVWELEPVRERWRRDVSLTGALEVDELGVVGWTADGTVVMLDPATGAERARHAGLRGIVRAATDTLRERVVLHDGRAIASLDADGWHDLGAPCEDRGIDAAAIGEDGAWVVCGGGALWLVRDGLPTVLYQDTGFGTTRRPASAIALSEPGTDLAIGGVGGDVLLLDLRGCMSEECAERDSETWFAAATPHAIRDILCLGYEVIALPEHGDAVSLRAGVDGELIRVPIDGGRHAGFVEGADIVAGGTEWRLWSIPPSPAPRRLVARPDLVGGAIAPDGAHLAVRAGDGEVIAWDLATGRRAPEVDAWARAAVTAPAPSAGARLDGPRRAILEDAAGGGVRAVELRDAEIVSLARSEDGRWLAAATTAGHVEIWDAATGVHIARLRGHRQRVTWVAFRGDALWSAGWDGVVLRWSVPALSTAPADLVADAERAWGLTLEDVLARRQP